MNITPALDTDVYCCATVCATNAVPVQNTARNSTAHKRQIISPGAGLRFPSSDRSAIPAKQITITNMNFLPGFADVFYPGKKLPLAIMKAPKNLMKLRVNGSVSVRAISTSRYETPQNNVTEASAISAFTCLFIVISPL